MNGPLDRPPIAGEFKDAVEHNPTYAKRVGSTPPFSLRLTKEEKAFLRKAAEHMPLGAYIQLLCLKGYPEQAGTLATSVFELGHTALFLEREAAKATE
jgi:hypothetical protein